MRQMGIKLKLNPLRTVVEGKRLVVVDDSIVRGNTQRALVRMLREAGAAEVHVRISSPPVKWPCFYGIDFASRAELIANGMTVEEIGASMGADSLGYISEDGMIAATQQPREKLCTACFTGNYPIELPDADRLGKNLFDAHRSSRSAKRPVDRRPGTSSTDGSTSTSGMTRTAERQMVRGSSCDPGPDSDLESLVLPEDRTDTDQ